jgi:hypothetical protein
MKNTKKNVFFYILSGYIATFYLSTIEYIYHENLSQQVFNFYIENNYSFFQNISEKAKYDKQFSSIFIVKFMTYRPPISPIKSQNNKKKKKKMGLYTVILN